MALPSRSPERHVVERPLEALGLGGRALRWLVLVERRPVEEDAHLADAPPLHLGQQRGEALRDGGERLGVRVGMSRVYQHCEAETMGIASKPSCAADGP